MDRAAYIIYIIIFILSTFMFGAVHTYMYTVMGLGVLLATIFVLLKNVRRDYRTGIYRLRLAKNSLHIGFLVILGFLVFQIVPLPLSLLRFLSPEAAVVGAKSLSVVQSDLATTWFPLAAYGYPVRMAIIRFVVYGLFFFGFLQTLGSRRRINVAVAFLLAMGCFEALYGLVETYSGSHRVLWYTMNYAKERVKGTFINGNHFAAYMAMGVVLAAAFAGAIAPVKRDSRRHSKNEKSLRSKMASFLEREEIFSKRILVWLSGIVMGIGLIFSASRGAILSWAGAMFLMGVLLLSRKAYRRKGWIFVGIFVLIGAYALQIGVEYPLERFMKIESGVESRSRYADRTMALFRDFKAAGVGVGNFRYAFPRYQSERDKKKFYMFAHNDWAQYMSEAGIAGLGLLLGAAGYYLFKSVRLWMRRKDPYAVCLGIVPVVALFYIGLHSFGEFSLHTPADVLILLSIMAIGYAALHLERHHRRDVMTYQYYELPLKYRGGVVLILVLALVGWSGYWTIKHFLAEAYCNTVSNSTLNRDQNPPVEKLVRAISWDPGNAAYWYKLADQLRTADCGLRIKKDVSVDDADGKGVGKINELLDEIKRIHLEIKDEEINSSNNQCNALITAALERAVALNPFNARYHLRLGWEYARQWKEADYHAKWLPAADISMDRAAYFAGVKNPHLLQELGNYWTMRSKTVLSNNPVHHEAWVKACRHYKKAQGIERGGQRTESKALKNMKREIREYVWNVYPDQTFVEQVIAN